MYSDYDMIAEKIRNGMYEGNMHKCLRDVGRIAGGCLASKRITQSECDSLGELAISLSKNKAEARRKWDESTGFGSREPLKKELAAASAHPVGKAIGWDEEIDLADYKIVDDKWLEVEAVQEPNAWNPCKELQEYINLLFEPTDYVAFCTDPFERDGKWIPSKGTYTKQAKDICKYLKKGELDNAIGTLNNEVSGAWIRINPFDGQGVTDKNVTEYRYALVEADSKTIDEQVAIYRKLELPCACIVHSGGKSAHAIVKVSANSLEEYRKRVDFLFEVCSHNGLPIDKQNRNPSRYSRMPGIMRSGKKQYIIERNIGKPTWDEWEAWIKDLNDDLPDFKPLTQKEFANPPALAEELIEGILRVGHKMCVVGPSKAGKSFILIELAIAIAEGLPWLGRRCRAGKVLYLNFELDGRSCTHRFLDVYNALGIRPDHCENIVRWDLRGRTMPLDKLAPKLIRRAKDEGYSMIIFDPIYKVLTGDENSASEMAAFCNNFDRISHDCKTAICYCHHHAKGSQGDRRSMDRASGSGVFARDPDALIDLLELDTTNPIRALSNKYECQAIATAASAVDFADEWRELPPDVRISSNAFITELERLYDIDQMNSIRNARAAERSRIELATGWRASFTLREFASPKPLNIWFIYPLHVLDTEEFLTDAVADGADVFKRKAKDSSPKVSKADMIENIMAMDPSQTWTVTKLAEQAECAERTVYHHLQKRGYEIKHGVVMKESK